MLLFFGSAPNMFTGFNLLSFIEGKILEPD